MENTGAPIRRPTYVQAIRLAVQEEARIKRQREADRDYQRTGKEWCIDCEGVDGHFSHCPRRADR